MKPAEALFSFALGGALYVLIELLYRGRSHWSMAIAGGFAFLILHGIFARFQLNIIVQCLIGALVITAIELVAGYLVNIRYQLSVWDYSSLPFNYRGQICLRYSLYWGLLTLPITAVSRLVSSVFR